MRENLINQAITPVRHDMTLKTKTVTQLPGKLMNFSDGLNWTAYYGIQFDFHLKL